MKRHLFLEGDMRLGKSQIIRQALQPYGEKIKKHPQVELLLVKEENLQETLFKVNSFVRGCMNAGGKSMVRGADR